MKGKDCIYCNVCSVTAGVGGAGGMSDGKLNLSPLIGGDLLDFVGMRRPKSLFDMVDTYFIENGAPPEDPHVPRRPWSRRAAANGIEFIPIRQKHIGSDMLPKVIGSMKTDLEKTGRKVFTGYDGGKHHGRRTIRSTASSPPVSNTWLITCYWPPAAPAARGSGSK